MTRLVSAKPYPKKHRELSVAGKFCPRTVTTVPPHTGPVRGEIKWIVGVARKTSTDSPILDLERLSEGTQVQSVPKATFTAGCYRVYPPKIYSGLDPLDSMGTVVHRRREDDLLTTHTINGRQQRKKRTFDS